jgi:hypothetical protein
VPKEVPFVRSIRSKPFNVNQSHYLVAMEDTVKEAIDIVNDYIAKETSDSFRKPPIMISRMGRGGKTTTLKCIYDALLNDNKLPMFITFYGNFFRHTNESQSEAMLRTIAEQLIDCNLTDTKNIIVSETLLDQYIEAQIKRTRKPFVLLIDELNTLSKKMPVDEECSTLLKSIFLDKPNRYLIFSTHIPLDLDTISTSLSSSKTFASCNSPRDVKVLNMPICFDIAEMGKMKPTNYFTDLPLSESVANIFLVQGIPSLYSSWQYNQNEITPTLRFHRELKYVPRPKAAEAKEILQTFLETMIDGMGITRTQIQIFQSFSSVSVNKKHSNNLLEVPIVMTFPILYLRCILMWFIRESDLSNEYVCAVRSMIDVLDQLFLQSAVDVKGKIWEVIFLQGLLQHLTVSLLSGRALSIFPLLDIPVVKSLRVVFLDKNIDNVNKLETGIQKDMGDDEAHSIVVFYPKFDRFPFLDFVLCYKDIDGKVKSFGFQGKSGEAVPTQTKYFPHWIDKMYLFRGKPKESNRRTRSDWVYLVRGNIRDILGVSLSQLDVTELDK